MSVSISPAVIFNKQTKLTLNLSFLKNLGVLFDKYITAFFKRTKSRKISFSATMLFKILKTP